VAVEILTGRGVYRVSGAPPLVRDGETVALTLSLERADGIERVVLRCRIAQALLKDVSDADGIIVRLEPWLVREFEHTREAALRAIRSERRLHEVTFDTVNRGPF